MRIITMFALFILLLCHYKAMASSVGFAEQEVEEEQESIKDITRVEFQDFDESSQEKIVQLLGGRRDMNESYLNNKTYSVICNPRCKLVLYQKSGIRKDQVARDLHLEDITLSLKKRAGEITTDIAAQSAIRVEEKKDSKEAFEGSSKKINTIYGRSDIAKVKFQDFDEHSQEKIIQLLGITRNTNEKTLNNLTYSVICNVGCELVLYLNGNIARSVSLEGSALSLKKRAGEVTNRVTNKAQNLVKKRGERVSVSKTNPNPVRVEFRAKPAISGNVGNGRVYQTLSNKSTAVTSAIDSANSFLDK